MLSYLEISTDGWKTAVLKILKTIETHRKSLKNSKEGAHYYKVVSKESVTLFSRTPLNLLRLTP